MSRSPHIMIAGSVMTDMTVWLDRPPAAGETIEGHSFLLGFGGKGANQAVMASLLGARVSLVACVGEDHFGSDAVANLEAAGIDISGVLTVAGAPTGVAPIWVDGSGENRIVIVPGANSQMRVSQVEEALAGLEPPDVVICQLEIPLDCACRALELGREAGAMTILNPAPFRPGAVDLLPFADWTVPNEVEFDALARAILGVEELVPDALPADVRRVVEALGSSFVVTNGDRGALLCEGRGAETQSVAAQRVAVVDSSGAGDAFVGALACSLAGGLPAPAAVARACRYASMTVGFPGTQASFAVAVEAARTDPLGIAGDQTRTLALSDGCVRPSCQ